MPRKSGPFSVFFLIRLAAKGFLFRAHLLVHPNFPFCGGCVARHEQEEGHKGARRVNVGMLAVQFEAFLAGGSVCVAGFSLSL